MLGLSVEEKTRNVLGWNEPRTSGCNGFRTRRMSGGSCASDLSGSFTASSSSTPSPTTPLSIASMTSRENEDCVGSKDALVFEKMRRVIHTLPGNTRGNALEMLLEKVSQEMDAAESDRSKGLWSGSSESTAHRFASASAGGGLWDSSSNDSQGGFPADLAGVDVSAFKSLLLAQPMPFNGRF
ncbi:unnamed protein product, partial [Mesorhabditis belari]|uniref:Uncharacterized protein n=1 Tax=Mesorhabditis belari TaxID=2138241 RepID=A0AAF3E9T8_9BILA